MTRSMRLLFCAPNLCSDAGGPPTLLRAIGRLLQSRGTDVEYLSADQSFRQFLLRLRSMDFSKFDVITNLGMWKPFNHMIARKAASTSVPLVCSPAGMLEPWSLAQKRFKKIAAWHAYQKADVEKSAAILATATSEAVNLRALGLQTPVSIIPAPIEIPLLSTKARSNARDDVKQKRILLFLSRLHPKKGLVDLIKAWARLRPDRWTLVLAGPDSDGYSAIVSKLIRSSQASDVHLVGPVYGESKTELLNSAALFVLPSYSENFGIVVGEALAHRLPVITTTATPWSELEETDSGWWIEPGLESLTTTLQVALSMTPGDLRRMGENGRRLVEERYSEAALAERYVKFYRWLAFNENPPALFQA